MTDDTPQPPRWQYELPQWLVYPHEDQPKRRRHGLLPRPPVRQFHSYGEAWEALVLRWAERWEAQDPDPTTETYP